MRYELFINQQCSLAYTYLGRGLLRANLCLNQLSSLRRYLTSYPILPLAHFSAVATGHSPVIKYVNKLVDVF